MADFVLAILMSYDNVHVYNYYYFIITEVIRVGVVIKNPLSISILLRNVTLSWNYASPTQSNEVCNIMCWN